MMHDFSRVRSLLEARRPGHTLPQAFYTDPDVFEFDLAAIYGRSWIMAGFEVELPKAGSWLSISIGRSPVLIVRDRSGILHAFHNTCRHRGAQICATGIGHSTRLVCPYHAWTYDLDGKLLHNTRMPEHFDRSQHGLRPIHVETIAGSVYVCLADEPPPFSSFRDYFEPLLAPHDLNNAKVAFESTLVEKANWKLVMENARECYHCAAKHPELRKTFPVTRSKAERESGEITQAFRDRMTSCGLEVGPVEGDWWQASRFSLNDGSVSLTMDGLPSVKKTLGRVGDGDVGTLRWALEPNSFCHALGDYVFMFSAMPTGPQETIVTSKWLVSKDAVAGVDFDVERLKELWTKTNDQDRALAENNQKGVNSLGYVPGPYSPEAESLVLRFTDWYCAKA
ncbi:MAG: aromatic ring-hydroxylating dioxygenase subunit alpha, partial [Betaproteobacteria bacterium]